MELFYYADSPRLPLEDIQELDKVIFAGWDDGEMPFNDNEPMPEHMRIITEDEFIANELGICYD